MKKLILTLLAVLFLAGAAYADNAVTFRWDKNTETDLAGYRLYQTTTTGEYTFGSDNAVAIIPVGTETVTLENVPDGTYFWVLTAYDITFNESDRSNEVGATLDSVPPNAPTILNITAIVSAP